MANTPRILAVCPSCPRHNCHVNRRELCQVAPFYENTFVNVTHPARSLFGIRFVPERIVLLIVVLSLGLDPLALLILSLCTDVPSVYFRQITPFPFRCLHIASDDI